MKIQSYKELILWKKSMELVVVVYRLTEKLPKAEMYGLVSQSRRCAVSIPSNIAEGYKRIALGEYIQFLGIADASVAELETQLILVKMLYPTIETLAAMELLNEVQKMLFVMVRKLKEKKANP